VLSVRSRLFSSVISGGANVEITAEVTAGLKNISAIFDGNTAITGAIDGAINIVGDLETLVSGFASGKATATASILIVGNILGEFESIASGLGLNVTGSADASAYTSILTKIVGSVSTLLGGFANGNGNVSVSSTLSYLTGLYGLFTSLAGAFTGGASGSAGANLDLSSAISAILSFCKA
jgi:hypothetical protein